MLLWDLAPSSPTPMAEDLNEDGVVNVQDLVLVAAAFGGTGQNRADLNGDAVVNIQDLVLVAAAFGKILAAPDAEPESPLLSRAAVQQWIAEARQLPLTDPALHRGLSVLQELLASLTPEQTALLPNYPNPFNPETWIPYQLAEPAAVSLTLYSAEGEIVRTLTLGHREAGFYRSRGRAAYWDGRNTAGELVASGLYFYTFTAGKFTATRKMVIRE